MFDFQKIIELRDALVTSLKSWESPLDGFYRSDPIVTGESYPSFTNTGIVLQAFNESGNNHLAQILSDRLIEYLRVRDYNPFPHEKAVKDDPKSHILCNAWPIFSILDCYPTRVEEFKKVCEWFLTTQKKDGSWDLIPSEEETKYPILTAYALSVILQFYDCCRKIDCDHGDFQKKLERSLDKGFEYLFNNRPNQVKLLELLLWPASVRDLERNPISFSTSAICMHMIAKASVLLHRDNWKCSVEKTLLHIVDNFDLQSDGNFRLGGTEVNMWDEIHMNESSINYSFAFFSPISLTTFLKFTDSQQFVNNEQYYNVIKHLTGWILCNKSDMNGRPGIKGSKFIPVIKTWSTAQSVIVLSRVIRKGYALSGFSLRYGQLAKELEDLRTQYSEIKTAHDGAIGTLDRINKIFSLDKNQRSIKILTFISILFVASCMGTVIYILLSNKIQSIWPEIEGKIWLGGGIISFVLSLIGFSIRKLREYLMNFFSNLIICLIQLNRLKKIRKEGTFGDGKQETKKEPDSMKWWQLWK
jgi:hypothetical protein